MKGRLNLFQRTMLRWRALHPYNAVHVLRIGAPLDVPRLSAAIGRVLEGEGLSGLALDTAHGRYEYAGGAATVALEVLPAGGDALRAAEEAIERELNAPFPPDGAIDPFRFFAIDAGETFLLGLAYDHFIAGGDSIVVLMKDLHDAYVDPDRFAPRRLALYPPAYGRLLARHALRLLTGTPGLVEMLRSCRTTARPHYRAGVPPTNAFQLRTVDAATLARAQSVAKQWGVTLNDLLLALLLQAMAPLAGERQHGRRRAMAVASILNLRADFQPPAPIVFGQFLSSFRVTHPMPAGQDARGAGPRRAGADAADQGTQALPADADRHRRQRGCLAFHDPRGPFHLPCQELPGLGRRDAAQRRRAVARGGRRGVAGLLPGRAHRTDGAAGARREHGQRGAAPGFFVARGCIRPRDRG